ncbi:MAG: acyl-CoA carboxylase subunit epsilon [Nitriliruptorales bacterium]|nr:acyl-CoA carboxylase subunit epsilon [Nitriliruptorales bacterium]
MSPTIRIVGGGEPTAEELAALTIALDALIDQSAEDAGGDAQSGWVLAALREGVGGPLVTAPPHPERF